MAEPEPAREVLRRVIRCPRCGGQSVYAASNPARPFCSDRCRNADFGAWASDGYRVASAPDRDDDSELPAD
ncbi:MAG: DNA gyrase inhibitor YacG [Caldimonas sp.]